MKLKQIALAAAVVAASSAALAEVTVYGIADVNVNNAKTEAGFSGNEAANPQVHTSQGRIGSSGHAHALTAAALIITHLEGACTLTVERPDALLARGD